MGEDSAKPADKIGALATIANSKAAEKLANAVEGLVQIPHRALDLLAGPARIRAIGSARAEVVVTEARANAEAERLRAETASFVLDRETHKTRNREAILVEAQKALPPPNEPVADEPVSKDFVHTFFEEFDGISDPEVHKIVGRLLAGEVVRPGSYPRRTMRVLRDLESAEFASFSALCRFCWVIGDLTPVVFEPNDPIYRTHGFNFGKANELAALGLISFGGIGGYKRQGFPKKFLVSYGPRLVGLEMKEGVDSLDIGKVMFTDAGRRLAPLAQAPIVPEFFEYVTNKFKAAGLEIATNISLTQFLAEQQASKPQGLAI